MHCIPIRVASGRVDTSTLYVMTKSRSVYRKDKALPRDSVLATIERIRSEPKLSLKGWTRVR